MKIITVRFSEEDLKKLEDLQTGFELNGLKLTTSAIIKNCINIAWRTMTYGDENPWAKPKNNIKPGQVWNNLKI